MSPSPLQGLITAPGDVLGRDFWGPVEHLFDAVWPHMTDRTDHAARLGAPWAPVTTPFAWFDHGVALAHVGVLSCPVVLDGQPRILAGVHAVCSHPAARRQGHVRHLMEAACRWIDARFDGAKLHTDHPDLYARFGFRPVPTWAWTSPDLPPLPPAVAAARRSAVPLDLEDPAQRERLWHALRAATPVSQVFASTDPGWLTLINAALSRRLGGFWAVPGAPWAVAWTWQDADGGTLTVDGVYGPVLPSLAELRAAAPWPVAQVVWNFCPDLLDARAVPAPRDTGLMVRGDWPAARRLGVSPLAEH